MVFSNACNYGIRAALYIATQVERNYVPIREISDRLNISFHFLTKILQTLTQGNIMISFRGPNGGVALARDPKEISLLDLITTIDGPDLFQNCLLGLDKCNDTNPCPLHLHWAESRAQLFRTFQETNLEEIADKVQQDGYRLTNLIE